MNNTENRIVGENKSIVYYEILTHLTKGYEKAEYRFYIKGFATVYTRYVHAFVGLKEVFWLYWKNGYYYGSVSTKALLAFCYVLGFFRYGWLITAIIKRIKQPLRIMCDLMRIYAWVNRNNIKSLVSK